MGEKKLSRSLIKTETREELDHASYNSILSKAQVTSNKLEHKKNTVVGFVSFQNHKIETSHWMLNAFDPSESDHWSEHSDQITYAKV